MRLLQRNPIQAVSTTFSDSVLPKARWTQLHEYDLVYVEVLHSSWRKGVRELLRTLRHHHQLRACQSPSFLFNVLIALEDDEAQFGPSSAHLLEAGQIGYVIRIGSSRIFGGVERLYPSSVRS